jgi:uncharacterized protein YqhQ
MTESVAENRNTEANQPGEGSTHGRDTSLYGGQAVIEGVMMKGKHRAVVACRNPKGEIVSKVLFDDPDGKVALGIRRIPFLRGFFILWDSLSLGMRALTFSAEIAVPEQEKTKRKRPEAAQDNPDGGDAE